MNRPRYRITGGAPLHGRVRVSGSKNHADYAIAAALLTGDEVVLRNVPDIGDVRQMEEILEHLGARVTHDGSALRVRAAEVRSTDVPIDLAARLRASFLAMGPLLARFGHAACPPPGGDAIGIRPLDVHLSGFRTIGAEIEQTADMFHARAPGGRLRGARVVLDYPSVMGTLNVMLAATLAEGTTTIVNAASEPEIASLAQMLNGMGAEIEGAGTHTVVVRGKEELHGTEASILPDRLEAGTFALAAAITGGEVEIEEAVPDHLDALIWKMHEAGARVESTDAGLRVRGAASYRAVNAQALPYPGLATDLQPQLAAFLTQAAGASTIHERVYDNRLLYVQELRKMGANIVATGQTAIISGPTPLRAAVVQALDVRAGSACVLAALVAEGTTEIAEVQHIDRAHERLDEKLRGLGAAIERV